MDQKVREAIFQAAEKEPFARAMQMRLVELDDGHSVRLSCYHRCTLSAQGA